jgi:hypothetical protein
LVRQSFFLGGLAQATQNFTSNRSAMSFLGSSPTVGRPTRRIDESCLSESSEISEKLIFFDFIPFSFLPAARRPLMICVSAQSQILT